MRRSNNTCSLESSQYPRLRKGLRLPFSHSEYRRQTRLTDTSIGLQKKRQLLSLEHDADAVQSNRMSELGAGSDTLDITRASWTGILPKPHRLVPRGAGHRGTERSNSYALWTGRFRFLSGGSQRKGQRKSRPRADSVGECLSRLESVMAGDLGEGRRLAVRPLALPSRCSQS